MELKDPIDIAEQVQEFLNTAPMVSNGNSYEARLGRLINLGYKAKDLARFFEMTNKNFYKVAKGFTLNPRGTFELKLAELEKAIEKKMQEENGNLEAKIPLKKNKGKHVDMAEQFESDLIDLVRGMTYKWKMEMLRYAHEILTKKPGASIVSEIKDRWKLH